LWLNPGSPIALVLQAEAPPQHLALMLPLADDKLPGLVSAFR
jgi:hypothetical protein